MAVGLGATAGVLEFVRPHVIVIVGIGVVACSVVVVVILLGWVVWEDVLGVAVEVVDRSVAVDVVVEVPVAVSVHVQAVADVIVVHVGRSG